MAENTTPAKCSEAVYQAARTAGLLIVTTADELVAQKFADALQTAAYAEGRKDERETLQSQKLWLWMNHVDGRPEFWAFDHPYPSHMDCGDPQTLGEPCGYALLKPCRPGRDNWTEESVLRAIARATTPA